MQIKINIPQRGDISNDRNGSQAVVRYFTIWAAAYGHKRSSIDERIHDLLCLASRHNVEHYAIDAKLTKLRHLMPCFLRESTDGVEPDGERSTQIRGRMEIFGTTDKVVICIVLISFVTGCTTMRPLPATDAQSIASHIEVGDKVQITRNDASDVKFKVEIISNEGLDGNGIFVAYSDILQISVREHSTAKTVGLIAAILVVVKGLYDYSSGVSEILGEI